MLSVSLAVPGRGVLRQGLARRPPHRQFGAYRDTAPAAPQRQAGRRQGPRAGARARTSLSGGPRATVASSGAEETERPSCGAAPPIPPRPWVWLPHAANPRRPRPSERRSREPIGGRVPCAQRPTGAALLGPLSG